MKKFLSFLLAVSVCFGMSSFVVTKSHAENIDPARECLMESLQLMVQEDVKVLDYSEVKVYNLLLQPIGYVYELTLNGDEGFAMVINISGYYETAELYPSKPSPFKQCKGMPVYPTTMCYLDYCDGEYIDLESGIALDEAQLDVLKDKAFGYSDDIYDGGSYNGEHVSEYVYYDTRTEDCIDIMGGLPAYYDVNPDLENMCAVNAGAVVLGYYGRYFPQLTPDFTVGFYLGEYYLYYNDSERKMQPIIEELYDRMGTNTNGQEGTTATGCRNGLKSYVNSKGLDISYTSIAKDNKLLVNEYKSQIENKKPSLLFFNTYNAVNFAVYTQTVDGQKRDLLERNVYTGCHVMVGYGYSKYTYYKDNTAFRTDEYLRAYTGVPGCDLGYVKLYESSILVEGYAVNIY